MPERADQPGAQARDRAVALRVARDVFERKAAALRKADQCDALGRISFARKLGERRADGRQRIAQVRLVLFERREERIRIPGAARRVGREIRDVALAEFLREPEHVIGIAAAPVQQDCGGACLRALGARGCDLRHHTVSASGGSFASSSARRGSRKRGSLSAWPSSLAGSSTAKPG